MKALAGSRGRTVLLVEDESMVALLAEDVLTEAGYCVLLAMRLPEALAALERERLDLAVLDVNLGGEDTSYPLASKLRSQGVPFVFATGYGTGGLADEFRDEAAIQKPYDPVDLLDAVAKIARIP